MLYSNLLNTPFGPIRTTVNEAGALTSLSFGPYGGPCHPDMTALADGQILEYGRGERTVFDMPLAPEGSEFQHLIWGLLVKIPYGETRSYGQLAKEIGQPNAARAVGRANATNPIALVVPCHRVIGANGSLTGFAYGVDMKRRLLEFEQRDRVLL